MVLLESTTQLREDTNQRESHLSPAWWANEFIEVTSEADDAKAATSPGSTLGNL